MKLRIRPDPYVRSYVIEKPDYNGICYRGEPMNWTRAYHLDFATIEGAMGIVKDMLEWSKKETITIE